MFILSGNVCFIVFKRKLDLNTNILAKLLFPNCQETHESEVCLTNDSKECHDTKEDPAIECASGDMGTRAWCLWLVVAWGVLGGG